MHDVDHARLSPLFLHLISSHMVSLSLLFLAFFCALCFFQFFSHARVTHVLLLLSSLPHLSSLGPSLFLFHGHIFRRLCSLHHLSLLVHFYYSTASSVLLAHSFKIRSKPTWSLLLRNCFGVVPLLGPNCNQPIYCILLMLLALLRALIQCSVLTPSRVALFCSLLAAMVGSSESTGLFNFSADSLFAVFYTALMTDNHTPSRKLSLCRCLGGLLASCSAISCSSGGVYVMSWDPAIDASYHVTALNGSYRPLLGFCPSLYFQQHRLGTGFTLF
mmetsp:Transcript_18586/g.25578  ORF Transcript_18586/g.25578 Transcript_18586/m.25578 type:complete len:274 (-) Transcript_18586:204-1025(-)